MNIPEYTNRSTQEPRSENVASVQAMERSPRDSGGAVATETAQQGRNVEESSQNQKVTREAIDKMVNDAQEQLDKSDVKLKFKVHEESDTVQVEIVDGDGKTIRKIPDDEMMKLSESLRNLERGILDQTS